MHTLHLLLPFIINFFLAFSTWSTYRSHSQNDAYVSYQQLHLLRKWNPQWIATNKMLNQVFITFSSPWCTFNHFVYLILSGQSDLLQPNIPKSQHLVFEYLLSFKPLLEFPLYGVLFPSVIWFSGHIGKPDLWPLSSHVWHAPLNCTKNLTANDFSLQPFSLSIERIFSYHVDSLRASSVSLPSSMDTRHVSMLSSTT